MRQSLFHAFKNAFVQSRAFYLHPIAFMVLCEMVVWARANGLSFYVSETFTTLDEDTKLNRKSATHREGRAFDGVPNNPAHTAPWPKEKIDEFINFFSKKYAAIAALSPSDAKPVLIVYHDSGTGMHFHVQFNKNFAVADVITSGTA